MSATEIAEVAAGLLLLVIAVVTGIALKAFLASRRINNRNNELED